MRLHPACNVGTLLALLLDKFFSQAGTWYRRAYIVRLWDALREKYTVDFYEGKIVGLRELLFDEQLEDVAACGPAESGDGLTCNAFPACPG